MFQPTRLLGLLLVSVVAILILTGFNSPRIDAQGKPPAKGGPVSFINDVAPILKESCFGCHGAKNPKGKLSMITYESFRKGGTKDDPIAPGKPDESYLVDVLLSTAKNRMPPLETGEPLAKAKIDLIARWIREGAKLDAGINAKSDLLRELRKRWVPPTPLVAYPFPVTVTAMTFTPDSKQLVVSGHHELTVWEPATGKLVQRIRTRARRTMALTWLPDGKLLAAGGRPGEEGEVSVYNINGGTPKMEGGVALRDGVNDKGVNLGRLLEADDEVLALGLSGDGKRLAAGGCDRVITVWDLGPTPAAAKVVASVENHADWVFGVALSADGQLLYSASRDKTAKVWDLKAKESIVTFPGHQNTVYGVAVKADGKLGFSVGEDNQLRAWNTTGAKPGAPVRNAAHGKAVYRLVQVAGKGLLVTGSADGTVRVWNENNLTAVRSLTGFKDQVFAVAVSPDGNLVAGGSFDGEVRVWKMADGMLVKDFNASPGYKPPTVAVPKK